MLSLALCRFPEEAYNRKHASAHLYQGGMDTVQRILTFMKRLIVVWFQLFHHRFVAWTKPNTTSLLALDIDSLARSKSELVAENVLLRVPLINLRRQVKRPLCTKTDRMLLVLLARMVRTWKQGLFIVQEDDTASLASPGLQTLLENKFRTMSATPKISAETVALIKEMAKENRL